MYYVYVLQSIVYKTRYVGSTEDVIRRLREHNAGRVRYTKGRMPWKIVYQENLISRSEAMKRELFLKTGQGRKVLDQILGKTT